METLKLVLALIEQTLRVVRGIVDGGGTPAKAKRVADIWRHSESALAQAMAKDAARKRFGVDDGNG